MADTNLAVSQWSPEYVQELSPAAQKIALLYYLSYLCLGKFSKLERIVRSRAVETQTLFGSSDATLMKCVLTSDNLVNTLFPMLVIAVEKKKPTLAVKMLGKAGDWITDIITDVKGLVQRYDSHNTDVSSAASDVIQEKEETNKNKAKQDQELKENEEALGNMTQLWNDKTKEIVEIDQKISSKTKEIQDYVRSITETDRDLGIVAAFVPFIGAIIKSIYDRVKDPDQVAHLKALEAELNVLIAEKTVLKQKQWQLQLQIIDWQMKVARASFERNSIPDPILLDKVQKSLSQIHGILVDVLNFWKDVENRLDSLKQKTFAGEDFLEEFDTFKDNFIDSIQKAKEAWRIFAVSCQQASVIFRLQTKDAYKFLEINPSSLSEEEWERTYKSVKKQLEEIDRPQQRVTSTVGPTHAAQLRQTSTVRPGLE
ncbi:uncharacterized protein LOC120467830 [Pimephales promelas]|uniref:uncharacterized protein LOC120467830 n=1 Tax=Pimephales promelas TaxID=90988 RepID=UPI001955BF0F|nr:uncharacterized protein LOC120467830 [Pimephales promelas]